MLTALAELQGSVTRPENEEEPGKIIHELRRRGGTDAFAERGRYYGTVDATPLFVMLAGESQRWGHLAGDDLTALWPHVEAALGWITRRIDADPTGWLRYQRSTSTGLLNQGWKDSWDGVTFADGRIPSGPIALAEVQGYAFAALNDGAALARAGRRPTSTPTHWSAGPTGSANDSTRRSGWSRRRRWRSASPPTARRSMP